PSRGQPSRAQPTGLDRRTRRGARVQARAAYRCVRSTGWLLVVREDVQQGFGDVGAQASTGEGTLGGGPGERDVGRSHVGGEALKLSQVLGHGTRIAAGDRSGESGVTRP